MGSLLKGFSKSPLKQWVLYQGEDVCTGLVVSRKTKIIKNKFSQKLLDVKEYTNVFFFFFFFFCNATLTLITLLLH